MSQSHSAAPPVVSDQQLRFFQTFGYLDFPGLIENCIDEIVRAFEDVWELQGKSHSGVPHDGSQRSCIVPFPDQHPRLCQLLDDARIDAIASALLGDDYNFMPSDGNYYAGDTKWHSDGGAGDILHIKIAYYLDPLSRETGCVRVIPGSHRFGDLYADSLSKDIGDSQDLWGLTVPKYRHRRSKHNRATWWCSTTRPSTPPSAEVAGGECSP